MGLDWGLGQRATRVVHGVGAWMHGGGDVGGVVWGLNKCEGGGMG